MDVDFVRVPLEPLFVPIGQLYFALNVTAAAIESGTFGKKGEAATWKAPDEFSRDTKKYWCVVCAASVSGAALAISNDQACVLT